MTQPRQLLPGSWYLVTRACINQEFRLNPGARTNRIVRKALNLAMTKTGIRIHAVCFMSNHWHAVISDPEVEVSSFLREVNRTIAKDQNAALETQGYVWDDEKPSIVQLLTEEDVFEQMAYVLVNPTKAGLVRTPFEWPGVISISDVAKAATGVSLHVIDQLEKDVESAEIVISRPNIFLHLSDVEFNRRLLDEVNRRVQAEVVRHNKAGLGFLGARAVLQQSYFDRPKFPRKSGRLHPCIACWNATLRVNALKALKVFRKAYRIARLAWHRGERDELFPAGTYALRIYLGVTCAAFSPL